MSENRLVHVSVAGERWDTLAHRYYGSVNEAERIIRANPHMPIMPVLPGGIRIFIPVVQPADIENTTNLPPWCGGSGE